MTDEQDNDLYEILGIHKTATKAEIKKAYHKQALLHHPDKCAEDDRPAAEIKFKSVGYAYEILMDDEKRSHYDTYGFVSNNSGNGQDVDIEELFNMFNMGGMGMGGMGMDMDDNGFAPRAKGRNDINDYDVTLEELYTGKKVKFSSTRNILCTGCGGFGGRGEAKKCQSCKGKGWTTSLRQVGRGLMTQEQVQCHTCNGSGHIYSKKCKKCKCKGVTEQHEVLDINIPKGAKDGDRIILNGKADEKPGVETGDIVFILREKPHSDFVRSGSDLSATVSISLAEALCGFSRVVLKHLDGRGIHITHPRGKVLKPNQTLKVAGQGMPKKGVVFGSSYGDLYLCIDIDFPDETYLSATGNIKQLEELLPPYKHEFGDLEKVQKLEFDPYGNIDDAGASEDDYENTQDPMDDEPGVQCAQQ